MPPSVSSMVATKRIEAKVISAATLSKMGTFSNPFQIIKIKRMAVDTPERIILSAVFMCVCLFIMLMYDIRGKKKNVPLDIFY
jgi:hypothetical protein